MINIYRIILLLITFILLSTYNPSDINLSHNKKKVFFKINDIEITNTRIIKESEIFEKLNYLYNKNIFTINKQDIENPISELDFLERIEVKKKYPNKIIIKIYETEPVAILIKNENKYYLDSSANLIIFKENLGFSDLPNIFGDGGENHFINFLTQLKNNNFPNQKIKSYYYYKIGRWDLQLLNDKVIKFPDSKIVEAIQKSVELLNREDFKNYNIIDLRIHDKIIVE